MKNILSIRIYGLAIFLLLSSIEPTNAQKYIRYTTQNGLPSDVLYNALQDSTGYILINSKDGLIRFDGTRFELLDIGDGFPDNELLSSTIDNRGRVWIIPFYGGLCRYKNGEIWTKKNDTILSKLIANSDKTDFWAYGVSIKGNSILYQRITSRIKNSFAYRIKGDVLNQYEFKIGGGLKQVAETGDGIYCFSRDSLLWLNEEGKELVRGKLSHSLQLLKYHKGFYYSIEKDLLKASATLYKSTLQKGKMTEIGRIKLKNINHDVDNIIAHGENLFVSQKNSIERYDENLKGGTTFFQFKESTLISGMCLDRQENLWVTTRKDGLFLFPNAMIDSSQKKFINFHNGYDFSILVKENGLVQITNGLGIVPNEFRFRNGIPSQFKANADYIFWTKDYNSMIRYDLKAKEYERINWYRSVGIYKDYDISKEYVAIATSAGLAIINMAGKRDFIRGRATSVKIDNVANTVHVGTLAGLRTYQKKQKVWELIDSSLTRHVLQLEQGRDGVLWVLEQNQLRAYYKNKVIGSLNYKKGLVSRTLNHFNLLKNKVIISTNAGVSVVDYLISNHSLQIKSISNYTKEDGLFETFIKEAGIFDGRLLVKTNNGNHSIPLKQSNNNNNYKPRIVALRANGQVVHLDSLLLNRKQNFISIDFASLLYAVQPNLYAYRLREQGANWQLTNTRTCDFPALNPGGYTFEVKAVYNNGETYSPIATLNFEIEPAFWQTLWFKILIAFLALVLIADAAYVWYKRREAKLSSERNFAQLKMQALKAQMNPHFIFNSLNSIQSIVNSGDIDLSNRYIVQFSNLIRQSLNYSSKDYIRLNDEVDFLHNYIQLEQLRVKNKFTYAISYSDKLDISATFLPPMFIQIYIENAIKHGVAPLESGGKVIINFDIENDFLVCQIDDNGVGRDKTMGSKNKVFVSKGTQLNEDRVDVYKSIMGGDIQIVWEDKVNILGDSNGTLVQIKIPLK